MADTALLYRSGPTTIASVGLDAAITEQLVDENEITLHPVEKGGAITDHVRPLPSKLTLDALVSNNPIGLEATNRVQSTSGENVDGGRAGYAQAAYDELRRLRDNGVIFTVTTELRTYENMVISSLSVPRSKDTGDALRFTVAMQQIRLVQNKTTLVKVPTTKEPKGKPKVDQGQKPVEETRDLDPARKLDTATGGILQGLIKG